MTTNAKSFERGVSSKRARGPIRLRAAVCALALVMLAEPILAETYAWLFPGPAPLPPSLQGERLDGPAPPFEFVDLRGGVVTLEDLRGKVVFLNFWATWCPPCVEELPSMEHLRRAMHGREFVILAASVDDDPEAVRAFFGESMPGFEVVMDDRARTARLYGTFRYPETYLIDERGRLLARFAGPRDWASPESVRYFVSSTR